VNDQQHDEGNMTKVWTREEILKNLFAEKGWTAQAIIRLNEAGVFDRPGAPDADFFRDVAKALPRWKMNMTVKQLARARQSLPDYLDHLVELANAPKHEIAKAPVPETAKPLVREAAVSPGEVCDDEDKLELEELLDEVARPRSLPPNDLWGLF
jgi:hypothetical protein